MGKDSTSRRDPAQCSGGRSRLVPTAHSVSAVSGRRAETIESLMSLADALERDRHEWISTLSTHEPVNVANDEVDKSVRTLRTYYEELASIEDRVPFGGVAVSLPFNNPLYSLILYTCGSALGGSQVVVRPSVHTASIVTKLVNEYWQPFEVLGIRLTPMTGARFIEAARTDRAIESLVFTGAYENLANVQTNFPSSKRLVYCGSGINPIVVGSSPEIVVRQAVKLTIDSRIFNSGQDCLCTERIYVHSSIADMFLDILRTDLEKIQSGPFGDPAARICPLVTPIAARAREILEDLTLNEITVYRSRTDANIIGPQVFETHLDSPGLMAEKFSPIFTVARYKQPEQLYQIARSEHKLGATLIGDVDPEPFQQYPHVTTGRSVLELEAENPHVPFGGRGKSGFSRRRGDHKDGPILYSVETTE